MKIEGYTFLFLLFIMDISAQTKSNRIYDLDIKANNDFHPLIFTNASQDIFNIKVNLTHSKYLNFGLSNTNKKLLNTKTIYA